MTIEGYLAVARRWWWLLAAMTIIGAVAGGLATSQMTSRYRAQSTLLVIDQATPGVSRQADLDASAGLAQALSELILVRPVLEETRARGDFQIGPATIRDSVDIVYEVGSQQIRIVAEADDPVLARDLANVLAETFIGSPQVALATESARISIVEPAVAPGVPFAPNRTLNVMLGAALALMLSLAVVLVLSYADDAIRSRNEIAELTGVPIVGSIRPYRQRRDPAEQLRSVLEPGSASSESFRAVRTNVEYILSREGQAKALLVTSPGPGEGKTSTVAGLAAVFGLRGLRTCVVDADLRHPQLHEVFETANDVGLSTLLLRSDQLEDGLKHTRHANVTLIPSGSPIANPSEVLGSEQMRELVTELRERFDVLILDSPPILGVTDATILGGIVDAVIMVVDSSATHRRDLEEAVAEVTKTGTHLAGTVVNRDRFARGRQGHYYARIREATEPPAVTDGGTREVSRSATE